MNSLTSMTSGDLVAQDVYLMHPTELLEQLPQIVFVHVVRHLADEHFYVVGIWLLHAVVVHYAATRRKEREKSISFASLKLFSILF